ncbi:MAG: phosphoribosylformylglycinamidine cyclo-ligase [Candidatus Jordarchaeales archaeon]
MNGSKMTYKDAGVDVDRARRVHQEIGVLVEKTFAFRKGRFGEVLGKFGHYANLIDVGGGRALALHSDGVGTKVLVAQLMDKYDTIGIDCVAMNANDLICIGAEPVALIDYLAVEEPREEMISEIMRGLVAGAEEAGMAIVGGETAIMPGVIKGAVPGKGFDLSAASVGVVEVNKIVTGAAMKPGDVVVGIESSGVHSNGITLARKVLLEMKGLSVHDRLPISGERVGEALLRPTRIYVKPVLEALSVAEVHGLGHVTGGAFSKLNRICMGQVGLLLDQMPEPHPVFLDIQEAGNVDEKEMYRTFNMGVGFVIVTSKETVGDAIEACKKHGVNANVIGRVVDEKGVKIVTPKGRTIDL